MQNIVFILTTLDAHAKHRVRDFLAHGFNVTVYSFTRSNERQNNDLGIPVTIVGSFDNSLAYHKRLLILYKGIKNAVCRHSKEDVCFYYLGLDVAMIASFVSSKRYIYEECDLSHTRVGNKHLRNLMEKIDKRVIKKSQTTIFTSEGFLLYHGLEKQNAKIKLLENKLPESIQMVEKLPARCTSTAHLSFGFAGSVRYDNIIDFARILLENFPMHEFHFFGNVQENCREKAEALEHNDNCHFHDRFKSPDDLPSIYSQLDFTLATYDLKFENVKYAEPNKLYEAVYFRTPIVVSRNTFLAEKVARMKMGYSVDTTNDEDVINFIRSLTDEQIATTRNSIELIPVEYALENNDGFFKELKEI